MGRATWTFLRHYVEMVLAMFAGMAALGLTSAVIDLTDGTGPEVVEMTVWMTVPMVAWMRYRGHGWRPTVEMAAAMVLPAVLALVLLWTGALTDEHGLLMLTHVLMLPAMLVAMLLRVDEYATHRHHNHHAPDPAVP